MLIFGSRGSQLALTQTRAVADAISAATGEAHRVEVLTTRGDAIIDRPLPQVGGKGLFTAELEAALREGRIDVAVHSLKDLPVDDPDGLCVGAIPTRADSGDVLIYDPAVHDPEGGSLPLAAGVVVGTSSPRRSLALRALRGDLEVRSVRGNVPTRIDKVRRGEYGAIVLAAAGLGRLGLQFDDLRRAPLPPERFVCAPGQGALGLQCRRGDARVRELLRSIHDEQDARCALAEREVLRRLGGGCSMPLGVHVRRVGDRFALDAALFGRSGKPPQGVFRSLQGAGLDDLVAHCVDELRPVVDEPLRSKTVLVVRASGGDSSLAASLAVAGAEVESTAMHEPLPVPIDTATLATALRESTAIAFTSARAVDRLVEEAIRADLTLGAHRLFAVGSSTAAALAARGLSIEPTSVGTAGGEALAELLAASGLPPAAVVCFPCAEGRHPAFETSAKALGFDVRPLPLYRSEPLAGVAWPVDRCDALVVTSPAAAEQMARLGPPRHRSAIAIGATTGATLERLGIAHQVAAEPTPIGLLEAIRAGLQGDRNAAIFERALRILPGGVSSPVRAFAAVGGVPRVVDSASGASFTDATGARYLDFVGSFGPTILGHAHPDVVAAVAAAAAAGLTYGAPHLREVELAERIASHYPGVERLRFTSSGTEATMSALRLARGFTGRDRILKFDGCYHGHADGLLVAAGSGAITFGEPSSAGVPAAVAALTSVLPLDDDAALDAYFAAQGDATAAVIVEPIPANNGLLLQRQDWLQHLAALCARHGVLLIFDEVISGFRVGLAGAAGQYGITPDLVTFGKIIGGGMPCGAFAGKAAAFERLAPGGPVYQAGTLSGNPVAIAAGDTTLRLLEDGSVYQGLEAMGARLQRGVEELLDQHPAWPVGFVRCGSLFWFAFGDRAVPRRADAIHPGAAAAYRRFFHACLDEGVYLAPSAYEVAFLSAAHGETEIDRALAVFARSLAATFAS